MFYPFFDVALIVSLLLLCLVDGKPLEGVKPFLFGKCYCQCGRCKGTIKHGLQVYFREGKTIKDLLVAPKDKDSITKKSGIICRYKCDRLECDEEYIGESARTYGERFREHLKAASPIYDHSNITGHTTALDNFSIVGREDHSLMRLIKEAIYIRSIIHP